MGSACGIHDGEEKCIKVLVKKKVNERDHLEKKRYRQKDNIKTYVKDAGWESTGLIWFGMQTNGALL